MKHLCWLMIVLASGCSGLMALGTAPQPEFVWVARGFSGGRQCTSHDGYRPPRTDAVLRERGVAVREVIVEPGFVCEACDCPSYSARHYALIARRDVRRAARAGFEPATPPDARGSQAGTRRTGGYGAPGGPPAAIAV